MKRNITSYGTSFINEFLKHYKLACVPKEDKYQNEHTINDIKKFEEILNKLSDEYVHKGQYKAIRKENEKLKEKMERYDVDIQSIIDERVKQKEKWIEEALRNTKQRIQNEADYKVKSLQTEKEELEKKLEKWKAMYTGQCEANRILIQKIERLENN
jgi:predicted RNase H-like nuclease (RuvC/YqgF family)